jgi:hypothetical protein
MSHREHEVTERTDAYDNLWTVSADELGHRSHLLNVLSGVVISRTEGLTRTTLRIRVGERTDLRVRWIAPHPTYDAIEIGQTVRITIPAEAVQLEAGGFRRGKQRWNRWIGRVVRVNRNHHDPVTTAKIHRDSIALQSVSPVIGAAVLNTWDTVNIVVDPCQIGVSAVCHLCRQIRPSPASFPVVDSQSSLVWLRATIQSVRAIPSGLFVALNFRGMRISTVIEPNLTAMLSWMVGTSVEISINRCDAWIRRCADSHMVLCSAVLVREIGNPLYSVPVQRADS